MTSQSNLVREQDIVTTMTRLADTLVAGFDQLDVLRDLSESCTRVLDADHAAVAVADGDHLTFLVASSEDDELAELMETEHLVGPSTEAFRDARHVAAADLTEPQFQRRWPDWTARAVELGFRAVDAFPMRLRSDAVGVLNLYSSHSRQLGERDVAVGTAFADIATTGLLQARAIADHDHVRAQLQHALDSRVVIEQAKGILSERDQVPPNEAFELLRQQSRSTNTPLTQVARTIISGQSDLAIGA